MKRTSILSSVVLLVAVLDCCGADENKPKPAFTNETGWIWQMQPEDARWSSRVAEGGLLLRLDDLKDDKISLNVAYPAETSRDIVKFRPVAFTASGQRFEFRFDGSSSTKQVVQQQYILDAKAISREQIKLLGIEKLTTDNLRNVVAPMALRKLKEAGVDCLPYPVIGKPYEFALTTIEGKRITSKDFQDKVVLLDFWARWCGPCMAKMPKLKETYRRLNPKGLEIIGINHDHSVAEAKRVIAKQELAWPHVMKPLDNTHRDLWEEATGVFSIPRLLLIDRNGMLSADVSPYELETEIEKLLAQR